MRDEDRALDAALARWARKPAGDRAAIARIVEHGAMLARARSRRWPIALGGLAAAAVALVLVLPGGNGGPAADGAELSFQLLYTPTFEEEHS
jgi:hypothetical protein